MNRVRRDDAGQVALIVVLIILILLFGGVGLAVDGLRLLLLVALVLIVVAAFTGYRGRGL